MPTNPDQAVANQNAQIAQVYGALQNDLRGGVGAQGQIFGQGRQGLESAYGSGIADMQSIYNDLTSRLTRSANALGLGGQNLDSAEASLAGTLASRLAGMTQLRTSALGALDAQGAAYKGIAERAVGDAGMQGARQQTDLATKLRNAILGANAEEEKARGEVDLQRLSNESKLKQLQMDIEGKRQQGELQLKQAQIGQQEKQNARDFQLAQMKSQTEKQDPLLDLKAQLMGAQIDQIRGKLAGWGQEQKPVNYGKGNAAMMQFLTDWAAQTGKPLDDNTINEARNIVASVPRRQAEAAQMDLNSPPDLSMALESAFSLPANSVDRDALQQALQIYYGGYTPGSGGGGLDPSLLGGWSPAQPQETSVDKLIKMYMGSR